MSAWDSTGRMMQPMTIDSADASVGSAKLPRGAKWACAAVAAVTFVVYWPTLSNGWVHWDDETNFLTNPDYRGLGPANLYWMFTTFLGGPYQPLSWITLAIDYLVWGEERPFGYHLTNVLLHSANAGLFAWVAARLFLCRRNTKASVPGAQCPVPRDAAPAACDMTHGSGLSTRYSALAFGVMVAVFWAVHPLRVEAVTWITERREVFCGLFTLAALSWYLGGGGRAAVFGWALAAMLAKGSAAVLPGLLVAIDLFRDPPMDRAQLKPAILRSVRRHAAVFALAAVMAVVAMVGQHKAKALVPWSAATPGARVDLLSNGLTFYVKKTVWPTKLAPMYEVPHPSSLLRSAGAKSRVAILAAFVIVYFARSRKPALLILFVAYVGMVLPVSGVVPFGSQIAADRYSYQPGWALSLLAGTIMCGVLGMFRSTKARSAAAVAVAMGCAVLLIPICQRMQRIWHDTTSLWDHQVALFPDTAIANYNIATEAIVMTPGQEADAFAEPYLRKAIAKLPEYYDAQGQLADLLARTGREDEAIEHNRIALESEPTLTHARVAIANIQWKRGRHQDAIAELRKSAEASGGAAVERCTLAKALAADGAVKEAIAEYEGVLVRQPSNLEALMQLSRLLSSYPSRRCRNGERAVELAERLRQASGKLTPPVAQTLAAAYAEVGAFERAAALLQEVAPTLPPEKMTAVDALIAHYQSRQPMRDEPVYP